MFFFKLIKINYLFTNYLIKITFSAVSKIFYLKHIYANN